MTSYTITEAHNQFSTLIHELEKSDEPIELTQHGLPVAVLLSRQAYERLAAQQPADFWERYMAYQERWKGVVMDIDEDIWADVRDRTPSSEVNVWELEG
jgi:prevent-host-death family protein